MLRGADCKAFSTGLECDVAFAGVKRLKPIRLRYRSPHTSRADNGANSPAEPDPAIREFIAGILAEFGHDVMTSANAIEAKVWIATSPFDVLITDLVLHSEQGVNLSRECAALGIRTITLTGREYR